MIKKNNEKKIIQFECKICKFITSTKNNYNRHCFSQKHIKNQNSNISINSENFEDMYFCCNCGNKYKERTGLWRHKKKCYNQNNNQSNNESNQVKIDNEVIIELLKQNNDFKELIIEQSKDFQKTLLEITKDGKYITNNTTNNNKFNMNFFLNEQCKGALDIMDFVTSLKVHLTDLENTGKIGYVKGISDIFLRGLKELDIHKRPIHCSDLKREVMYVKDKDVWEKDSENKKIKKAILHIADKNFNQLQEWIKKNPESKNIETKKHEQYMEILCKCTGGIDNNEDEKYYNKIISNVAKEVIIDK
jgi:hypothetical protein